MFTTSEIMMINRANRAADNADRAYQSANISNAQAHAWKNRALHAEDVALSQKEEIARLKEMVKQQAKTIAMLNAIVDAE